MEEIEYKFTLADFNTDLIKEWSKTPYDFYDGNIFDFEADAILIPGNSFGIMQDGIEQIALYHFGKDAEREIRSEIKRNEEWNELLVGRSIHIKTNKSNLPALIYSPIYRVPKVIADPVDVYIAFRDSVHTAICQGYTNIVFPGFGTQTGKIKEDWAVRMMNAAIEDALNKKDFPKNLKEAENWHYQAYPL